MSDDTVARLVPPLGGERWPAPVRDRVVLVTGGAGSIGRAVCRRCLAAGAARVVLADVDENGLYFASRRFERAGLSERVAVEIANVREPARVRRLFERYRPGLVLHAAAHKHVPLLESAPCEAVRNNVLATVGLCATARDTGADFVLVSTDKAVAPTSILGATKRVAERVVHAHGFAVARMGNVLDSAGSVVPLFREQIAAGGPVTVTHREATRFFLRVEDAAALVVAAAAADHGPLLVAAPAAPLAILSLAEALIAAAPNGFSEPIPIEFVGLRPGEKLHERLLTEGEAAVAEHPAPHLVRVREPSGGPSGGPSGLDEGLTTLEAAARREDDEAARQALAALH